MSKSIKCDESCLPFCFTSVIIKREKLLLCVLCLTILAANSMKPNKLKRHLYTKHSKMKNKPEEYFRWKTRWNSSPETTTVSFKALLASYPLSYWIEQNRIQHAITGTVIFLAAIRQIIRSSVENVLSRFVIHHFQPTESLGHWTTVVRLRTWETNVLEFRSTKSLTDLITRVWCVEYATKL
jgi:hypothetical protein